MEAMCYIGEDFHVVMSKCAGNVEVDDVWTVLHSYSAPTNEVALSTFPACKGRYSQEWGIDQLLQFCRRNFICLIFAWFFKAKYSIKICPS